jgi:hypothetical protein
MVNSSLCDIYPTLSAKEQEIIQILALSHRSIKKSYIQDVVITLKVFGDKKMKEVRPIINGVLDTYMRKDFMDKSVYIFPESSYIEIMNKYCMKNRNLERYRAYILKKEPLEKGSYYYNKGKEEELIAREFFFELFSGNLKNALKYNKRFIRGNKEEVFKVPVCIFFEKNNRFNQEFADFLDEKLLRYPVSVAHHLFRNNPVELMRLVDYISEKGYDKNKEIRNIMSNDIYPYLLEAYFKKEMFEELESFMIKYHITDGYYWGVIEFQRGDLEKSNAYFLSEYNIRKGRKRTYFPSGIMGQYFCLSFILTQKEDDPIFLSVVNSGSKKELCYNFSGIHLTS